MNTNYFKKLIFFCFGLLISGIAISQVKNVISIQRVFPKIDKVAEFEKAIAEQPLAQQRDTLGELFE